MNGWIDIALEEGIRFFVTSLGKPDWVCEKVHAYGGVVYHDVTNRKWAEKGKECGVDGLICVNDRAGGHLGPMSMQEIYDELSDMGLPLICAGGIGSEAELNRALEIGYDGVQMGTRFIATIECNTPEDYKDAIVDAGEEDITWTNRLTGVPISVIKSPGFRQENSWLIRKLLHSRFKHRARTLLNVNSFIRLRYLSRSKSKNTAKKKKFYSAGKSVETVRSIESATVIMRRLGESLDSNPKLANQSEDATV
jgi:nitronate monooxygenase